MEDQQFRNDSLQQALEALKAEQNNENLLRASYALINTKVLCPAKWDKEPQIDDKGAMHFAPDTKIQLMVVTNDKKEKFYPFFTNMEQVSDLYKEEPVTCLILSMEQYLPFLAGSKGTIRGVVLDPANLNVVFPTEFLEGLFKANKKALDQTMIRKGDKVHLRNLTGEYQDLEAALISCGFHDSAIRNIYIKERMEDPAHPEQTHWFVIVDADNLDTGIFARIGQTCQEQNVMHGKNMEFMFTDKKLGKDIAATSKPIYTRLSN